MKGAEGWGGVEMLGNAGAFEDEGGNLRGGESLEELEGLLVEEEGHGGELCDAAGGGGGEGFVGGCDFGWGAGEKGGELVVAVEGGEVVGDGGEDVVAVGEIAEGVELMGGERAGGRSALRDLRIGEEEEAGLKR